jgi:hypothetical protein
MKTKIKLVTLFLMLFAVTLTIPQKANSQGISISFQVFYDELSPYGNWVFTPEYGYAWLPNVEPGFFPYATDGYWVFTNDGWTWVSFYTWGWAPFHYGRWFVDNMYGPMWVPGYDWGPAWVIWGRSGDCYGWAPMAPGVTFDMVYGRHYHVPNNYWRFVRERDFGRRNIYNYYIDNSTHTTIVNNYTVINNVREDRSGQVRYGAGPDRREVERNTGRTFSPVAIKESTKPRQEMSNNELVIYKPRVEKTESAIRKPAPANVVKLENIKSSASKNPDVTRKSESPAIHQKQVITPPSKTPTKQEAVKQQRENQAPKSEAVKQQRENPPAKSEAVKQQRENPPAKPQAVKQARESKPSGKVEAKPRQDVKQSGNPEPAKQPKQSGHTRNAGGGKQQHNNPSKKEEK